MVEGVTEFLPVSSTEHLLVTERLLDLSGSGDDEAADAYVIAVQLGAILAVRGVCRRRVAQIARGLAGRNPDGRLLAISLLAAFAPAAVVGALFGGAVKDRLFDVWPVICGVGRRRNLPALVATTSQMFATYGWQTSLLGTITAFISAGLAARWLMA